MAVASSHYVRPRSARSTMSGKISAVHPCLQIALLKYFAARLFLTLIDRAFGAAHTVACTWNAGISEARSIAPERWGR
jgi:hypothetical protein